MRSLERILWTVAVIALSIYALAWGERWLYQRYLAWEFTDTLPAAKASHEMRTAGSTAFHRALLNTKEQPLGRLEIPSIGLHSIFLEGVEDRTLRRGIGHIPGTALPAGSGNTGLAAHRDTFFSRLGEVQPGDAISITTLEASYRYVVESIQIVDPDEAVVLHDIGRPVLTLVTCYPFQLIGPAPKRYIVHASLQD